MTILTDDILRELPYRRISPEDGMSVTAEVWAEAHNYHRLHEQYHRVMAHETGILSGLQVIASDPADDSIYVLPGVAVDSHGRLIIVRESINYDLGRSQGLIYLILTYGESPPRPDESRVREDGAPLYVETQFSLEAVESLPATAPYVEIARIRRRGSRDPILNAPAPHTPNFNEIDLRFQKSIAPTPTPILGMAVAYVDGNVDERQAHGTHYLARSLSHTEDYRLWVDYDIPLEGPLKQYTLLYLVGQGNFQLDSSSMNRLYEYLQEGGTILFESNRQVANRPAPAEADFRELVGTLGISLKPLENPHDLLVDPYVFSTPPPGFEVGTPNEEPVLEVGGGVIFSTYNYGRLWQGQQRSRAANRTDIRNAMEWGANIIAYARNRRAESEG
jgi:hypothetical protein